MVDYIADYLETIRDRRVFPDVKPGYMRKLIPDEAPEQGENWDQIFGDVERVIMPGVSILRDTLGREVCVARFARGSEYRSAEFSEIRMVTLTELE